MPRMKDHLIIIPTGSSLFNAATGICICVSVFVGEKKSKTKAKGFMVLCSLFQNIAHLLHLLLCILCLTYTVYLIIQYKDNL